GGGRGGRGQQQQEAQSAERIFEIIGMPMPGGGGGRGGRGGGGGGGGGRGGGAGGSVTTGDFGVILNVGGVTLKQKLRVENVGAGDTSSPFGPAAKGEGSPKNDGSR
ncbi:MAG TPA: hypothetical protein VE967_04660, partial [Gemmatimonadaceae bacterium]|nr:hypothetical protein [Gemmatimonadaceae bacterium]